MTPRVLNVLRTLDPRAGGPVSYLAAAATAMKASGDVLTVAAISGNADAPADGSPLSRLPRRVAGPAQGAAWLFRNVRDYAVVHIHGVFSWPLLLAAGACRYHGVPYAVSPHGNLSGWALRQRGRRKALYLRLLGDRLLRGAAALVVTTPLEARLVQARLPGSRVRLICPGVAISERAKDRGGAAGELRIGFLGRFSPEKALPVLLHAIALLKERGTAVHLALAGSGERAHESLLRAQVRGLGLEACVSFSGFVDAKGRAALFRSIDVLALPSWSESFSFAVAEALAAGLPVVVSQEVGLADAVRDHRCGSVVAAGDVRGLADALARYCDPGVRVVEGGRARHYAGEALSLQRMGESLATLYRELAR